ncbi:class I SAM-dependent methyltransferase [Streptomyces caniscabiei]|uniref:class I SAM-dependent methyltransferase n=1 Tax=Streptomyces caniscabiei TaxID=2746961 RepID=UPI0029AAEAEA|nr:class I SAM-dependent methyltransferase [Streptomyces caniscabiei]MDX2776608.1 class I SAM-dependent methyltransferase [Streptomyces caniscabiei]
MKDQLTHWNNAHKEQWLHKHSTKQTAFAEEVQSKIPADASILELGCGEGNDSFFFAEQGHVITATDFSDVVIKQNEGRWSNPRLTFTTQDISQPLQFSDASFNVVYARLSLHYFTDETTRQVFREIARVVKPGGMLCFMCKSTNDHIYGKGEKIEDDMYELKGHVRHFFSPQYAAKLLNNVQLRQTEVQTGEEQIYDRQSAFIKVIATKPVAKS